MDKLLRRAVPTQTHTCSPPPTPDDPRIARAASGDPRAMGDLFHEFAPRLKTMVRLRMDRRLQGRVDHGFLTAGEGRAEGTLRKGWNQVLAKVANDRRHHRLHLRIEDLRRH